jgi:hypothetical protein
VFENTNMDFDEIENAKLFVSKHLACSGISHLSEVKSTFPGATDLVLDTSVPILYYLFHGRREHSQPSIMEHVDKLPKGSYTILLPICRFKSIVHPFRYFEVIFPPCYKSCREREFCCNIFSMWIRRTCPMKNHRYGLRID